MSPILRHLKPIHHLMEDRDITDICINRPGEVYCDGLKGWICERIDELSYRWAEELGKLVGSDLGQEISQAEPILSGALPSGERIQIVVPPAVEANTISITIRKPSTLNLSLDELNAQGVFSEVCWVFPSADSYTKEMVKQLRPDERELFDLAQNNEWCKFLKAATEQGMTQILSGSTGSGKTTIMKALLRAMPPWERPLTVEDAPELDLSATANHVRLFYSTRQKSNAGVRPEDLLRSTNRMFPSRVLIGEIRDSAAADFVDILTGGHGGTITTVHANSALVAFERLINLVLKAPAYNTTTRAEVRATLYQLVDVIIQTEVRRESGGGKARRVVSEILYDPFLRRLNHG